MEIERKWLVDKSLMPDFLRPEYTMTYGSEGVRIEQYYLNTMGDEWTIRIRKFGNHYVLELKSQGMLSREELGFRISQSEFEEAKKHAKRGLKKTRYYFSYAGHVYEFDEYDDYDFITCEVEFKSEDEAMSFVPHSCCVTDVTNFPQYKNINLAK